MITSRFYCYCGCAEVVEVRDPGFAATEVEMDACQLGRDAGATAIRLRKSALALLEQPNANDLFVRAEGGMVLLRLAA